MQSSWSEKGLGLAPLTPLGSDCADGVAHYVGCLGITGKVAESESGGCEATGRIWFLEPRGKQQRVEAQQGKARAFSHGLVLSLSLENL